MRSMRVLVAATALLCIVMGGCSRRPSMVLDQKEMASLLADLYEAEGMADQNYKEYQSDTARRALRQSVYAKHGVNQETMDSSLAWYGYHMDQYIQVYDRTLEILEKRMSSLPKTDPGDNGPTLAVEGDTATVWRSKQVEIFSPRLERRFISTHLLRDRYWQDGDSYQLLFKSVRTKGPVEATLTAVYSDGTNRSETQRFSGVGWQNMRMETDTTRTLSQVLMSLYYDPSAQTAPVAAIDSISLVRTHPTASR